MTAKQLTDSILQMAIQGKLVPQDPNDEPASVLLERIREEKRRLVAEGKLKANDIVEKPIEEQDYPYAIPESWEWVRLEDITIYISRGKSPVYSETKKYPVVAQKCNQWSGFSLEKAKFADPKTVDKYAEERLLQNGDLLWNSTGIGTLGRIAIYDSSVNEYGWAVADSHVTVIRTRTDFCFSKFLYYYFASPEVQRVIEDKSDGSTKQKELAQETVRKYEVPLPPLAEQHRIVDRIEEYLPVIKEYGEAYEEASKMDAELPDNLKKSILQEAIMGKLGTQDPSDAPASCLLEDIRAEKQKLVKEGVLKKKDLVETPISEDEKPFEIPESWEWTPLSMLIKMISGTSYSKNDVKKDGVRILRGGNIQNNELFLYDDDVFVPFELYDNEKNIAKYDIVIVASTGSKAVIGKPAFIRKTYENVQIGAFLRIIRPHLDLYASYLEMIFSSEYYRKHIRDKVKGTNINNIKSEYIEDLLIPFPPLAEQHRIVKKVEELFGEIDNMTVENNININEIEVTDNE